MLRAGFVVAEGVNSTGTVDWHPVEMLTRKKTDPSQELTLLEIILLPEYVPVETANMSDRVIELYSALSSLYEPESSIHCFDVRGKMCMVYPGGEFVQVPNVVPVIVHSISFDGESVSIVLRPIDLVVTGKA
jgi:hypothetical protein